MQPIAPRQCARDGEGGKRGKSKRHRKTHSLVKAPSTPSLLLFSTCVPTTPTRDSEMERWPYRVIDREGEERKKEREREKRGRKGV
jgi:CRISPR/Cas system CSM-associated protein Csm4 (group 5 of RAMP superfamily)